MLSEVCVQTKGKFMVLTFPMFVKAIRFCSLDNKKEKDEVLGNTGFTFPVFVCNLLHLTKYGILKAFHRTYSFSLRLCRWFLLQSNVLLFFLFYH